MRKVLFLITLVFYALASQAQIVEAKVKINKLEQDAFVAQYNFDKGILEQAIAQQLKNAGLSNGKSRRGLVSFQGVNWPEISKDKVDVYYEVAGKRDKSTATLWVSKGYDNYVSSMRDSAMGANIHRFLYQLNAEAQVIQKGIIVAAQTKLLQEKQAECKKLQEEEARLKRDLEKVQNQINDCEKQVNENSNRLKDLIQS